MNTVKFSEEIMVWGCMPMKLFGKHQNILADDFPPSIQRLHMNENNVIFQHHNAFLHKINKTLVENDD